MPFILTPEAKSNILQGEASVQKQHVIHSSAMTALMQVTNENSIHPLPRSDLDQDRIRLLLSDDEYICHPSCKIFLRPLPPIWHVCVRV